MCKWKKTKLYWMDELDKESKGKDKELYLIKHKNLLKQQKQFHYSLIFYYILIIFITLKLIGIINMSWWWCLLIIPVIIFNWSYIRIRWKNG